MLEIIIAGGWVMGPILLCSVLAMAIVLERSWALSKRRIAPDHLVGQVWEWFKAGELDQDRMQSIQAGSPLGKILATALINLKYEREVMERRVEEVGRHVAHDLERFLNTLGTIASVSPFLGLLGTVLGMIKIFTAMSSHGLGNHVYLAGGIAEALITTAAGLMVAIPSLFFYRYLRGRVDRLVVTMEQEALRLIETVWAHKEPAARHREPTAIHQGRKSGGFA